MIVLILWNIFFALCVITSLTFYILDSFNIIEWNMIFYGLPILIGLVSIFIPIVVGIIKSSKEDK